MRYILFRKKKLIEEIPPAKAAEDKISTDDESSDDEFNSDHYSFYGTQSFSVSNNRRGSSASASNRQPGSTFSSGVTTWNPGKEQQTSKFQRLVEANDVQGLTRIVFSSAQVREILPMVLTVSTIETKVLKYLLTIVTPLELNLKKLNLIFDFSDLDEASHAVMLEKQKILKDFFNPPANASTPSLS